MLGDGLNHKAVKSHSTSCWLTCCIENLVVAHACYPPCQAHEHDILLLFVVLYAVQLGLEEQGSNEGSIWHWKEDG
jgi:hypothetical protein